MLNGKSERFPIINLKLIPHIRSPCQFFSNGVQEGNILQLHQSGGEIIFPNRDLVVGADQLKAGIHGTNEIVGPPLYFKR